MVKAERIGAPNGVKVGRGFRRENGHEPTFASTLIAAANACEIKTLTEFSHGSGVRVDVLSLWVSGKGHPLPASFETAVSYLRGRGAPEEVLVGLSGCYEAHRKDRLDRYKERNNTVARKKRIEPPLPLGRFIEKLADKRGTTVTGLNRDLGYRTDWLNHVRVQKDMTQETLLRVLSELEGSGILSEEEAAQMEEAASATIIQILEQKGRMVPVSPLSVKRQQGEISGIYTGEEAGKELGISRGAVAEWRKRLGIEHILLTHGNIVAIRKAKNGKGNPDKDEI